MIFTILNLLFYNLIFISLYYFKKINLNLLIIFFFLLLSVFFFNGFLFHPGYMPDQEAYLILIKSIRSLNFYFLTEFYLDLSDRTFLASGLMTLVPTLFVNNELDVSLAQKFLYLCTVLYLYNKKALNHFTFSIFLFLPTLVLYTGVALKESILFFFVTLSFYFALKKKYFLSIIFYLILLFIKPLIFIFSFSFNFFYLILFEYNFKKIHKIVFCSLVFFVLIILILFNLDFIGNELNERRSVEAVYDGREEPIMMVDVKNINSIFQFMIFSSYNFLLNPNIISSTNIFQFFQSIENIFLMIILIFNFAYCYNLKKSASLFWLLYLIVFIPIIGGTALNAGTLSRWKIEIITYYLFYINFSCLKIRN